MNVRIWIIIPTYEEAENIESIVHAVRDEMNEIAAGEFRILIVDDNSTDGTGQIADRLAADGQPVEVMHRSAKDGLGRAYIAGFNHALSAGGELFVQMDADFSHNPKYLKDLITAADEADVVLGSRYVTGGGVRNWGIARKAVSRGGSAYARTVLSVGVRDLTGGFKCIRRDVLETIDLATLRADGYVFQIEVTYRALQAGFTVKEIPILFSDRAAGTSKMSWRIALEAMLLVPSLRTDRTKQLTRS